MAPTRLAAKQIGNENCNGLLSHGITTRSKQLATLKSHKDALKGPNKRKADSPVKEMLAKRAAFGDITNALNKSSAIHEKDKVVALKKVIVESKLIPSAKNIKPQITVVNGKLSKGKIQKITNGIENEYKPFTKEPLKPIATRAQNGILKNAREKILNKENQNKSQISGKSACSDGYSEPSLYLTALEYISPSDAKEDCRLISEKLDQALSLEDSVPPALRGAGSPHRVPPGVTDFDLDNWDDPNQVSHYAMDIFNYLKNREDLFAIDDYLQRMKNITSWMRALLVDWMVEVQESFELNHETLYLAVKLVDIYLSRSSRTEPEKKHLTKEELQLLGAASLFVAAKYDERIPPLVDDFLYICDGAYSLSQLLTMEMRVLRTVDYCLGVPLSYRFLRRYARCSRVSMPTLTLARFVLEQCLLEYALAGRSDSKMAAAALYLALRMKALGGWTPALVYYSGYRLDEILPLALEQNAALHKKPKSAISTVRNKYSHTIFFEVAKIPLIEDSQLLAV